MEYRIIKYQSKNSEVEIYFDDKTNTPWINKGQLSILLSKDRSVISKMVKKIMDKNLLDVQTNVQNLHVAFSDKPVAFYSVDLIRKLGEIYQSKNIVDFLRWCDSIKDELLDEYSAKSNIITFNNNGLAVDARISPEENTVYLTQNQMAVLFGTTRQNITIHITNIIDDGELDFDSTCKKSLQVQIEGGRRVNREVEFYNLDMILSVGYRVNSKTAISFRRWASSVLKDYLLKGYAINEKRTMSIADNYLTLFDKVVSLDNRVNRIEENQKYYFIQDKIIFEDQMFNALLLLTKIVQTATKSIILIDPYIDVNTLEPFKHKKAGVLLKIYTSSRNKLSNYEIDIFNNEYGDLSLVIDGRFHDRYLIIDKTIFYHLGSSVNFIGKRFSQITLIEDSDIKQTLIRRI